MRVFKATEVFIYIFYYPTKEQKYNNKIVY